MLRIRGNRQLQTNGCQYKHACPTCGGNHPKFRCAVTKNLGVNLPTPVLVDRLHSLLIKSSYDPVITQYLIDGFTFGFRIPFSGPLPVHCFIQNHHSVLDNISVAMQMIELEKKLGRIAGPFSSPPLDNFILSPLGLVPKKDTGSFRLIHDLSFPSGSSVNSWIPREFCTVSYEDFDYFIALLSQIGQGCFISKADIESAFRIVPINPSDYHLLGFSIGGKYYYDKCLPMGCSVSCMLFEDFSCALQWVLQKSFNVLAMTHILDDFIFLSPQSMCHSYLTHMQTVADIVGIPLKHSKTVLPATCVVVHGIEIDTRSMQTRLQQDKLTNVITLVRSFSRRKQVTLRELQSLIGTLNFACKVVTPGRPFLRRLIDLTIWISKPNYHLRLNREARLDLSSWLVFLQSFNGVSVLLNQQWLLSEKLELFTDASNKGYAGILNGKWFQGNWPPAWLAKHIAIKELYPIVAALKLWPPNSATSICWCCAIMKLLFFVINNQSSRDAGLMSLVRTMTVAMMRQNVVVRAKHVPGKSNMVADMLSRFQDSPAMLAKCGLDPVRSAIPQALLPWTL